MVVLGGFGASAYLLKSYLSRDGRFRIAGASNIEATGLTEVSRAQMLPVFGEDIGRNIFFVPLGERRKQLEEIPWIERATVMRLLPDQIRVSVVERQPIAFVRQGAADRPGRLERRSAHHAGGHDGSASLLVSGGHGHQRQRPAGRAQGAHGGLSAAAGRTGLNGQHISEQISEIDLTDPEDAQVLMPEQGGDILVHFGEDRFLERYQRYKAHIDEWRQQYPKLAAVDLRYDQKVVLADGFRHRCGASRGQRADGS